MTMYRRYFQEPGISYFLFGPRGKERLKIGKVICCPVGEFLKNLIPNQWVAFDVRQKSSRFLYANRSIHLESNRVFSKLIICG